MNFQRTRSLRRTSPIIRYVDEYQGGYEATKKNIRRQYQAYFVEVRKVAGFRRTMLKELVKLHHARPIMSDYDLGNITDFSLIDVDILPKEGTFCLSTTPGDFLVHATNRDCVDEIIGFLKPATDEEDETANADAEEEYNLWHDLNFQMSNWSRYVAIKTGASEQSVNNAIKANKVNRFNYVGKRIAADVQWELDVFLMRNYNLDQELFRRVWQEKHDEFFGEDPQKWENYVEIFYDLEVMEAMWTFSSFTPEWMSDAWVLNIKPMLQTWCQQHRVLVDDHPVRKNLCYVFKIDVDPERDQWLKFDFHYTLCPHWTL